MIPALEQLKVIFYADKRTLDEKVISSGVSRTTINEIMHGKNDNPTLQTFVALLEDAGAELVIKTEQSEQAIADQDISYYRQRISETMNEVDRLHSEVERLITANEYLRSIVNEYKESVRRKDSKLSQMIDYIMNQKE